MNEILIYGDIGFEVTPASVVDQLGGMEGPITVRVDSYGGDVYAGISILNALRRYPDEVTVYVDGMAASAASYIAVGGADRLLMSPNSSMLVHGAWSQGTGNSFEFAEMADNLAKITDNIASIYAAKSGKDKSYWLDVMKKDTTYSAEQAVEIGLADAVAELQKSARAEHRHAIMASQRSRFLDRAGGAGVPEIESRKSVAIKKKPSDGQNGDTVSIVNQLAQELGKSPEDVQAALSGFFNESVPISGEVEVSYPSDVKIVPTEKITIEPIIGDKVDAPEENGGEAAPVEGVEDAEPAGDSAAVQLAKQAGLTFAMGDIAEGFTAEVDEAGAVTVTAPSGAEVGSTAAFTVLVNETAVALSVTVRSLSEEPEEDPAEQPAEPSPVGDPAMVNKKVLDIDTYNELKAAAQFGWSAMEAKKESDLVDEVDGWIREGRISAGLRAKAVAAMKRDPATARDLYGANPVNTIPRGEVGYGRQSAETNHEGAELRQKPNPFPKPKF